MQRYIIVFILSFLLVGCGNGADSRGDSDVEVLSVTIEPQRYFLEKIVGNKFQVRTLVPSGASPEMYEPAPSTMVDLSKSKLYFIIGDLGFEKAWGKKLKELNDNVGIVDCSEGLSLLEDIHDHDHGENVQHEHGTLDPHIWTSPVAAKVIAQNMYHAMLRLDPDNSDYYEENYESLVSFIEETDNNIQKILEESNGRSFIIYHPALGYFADQYSLTQYSIEFEGKNPSPAQMKRLLDMAKKENIKTVFVQKGFDKKNGKVVAQETGASVHEIDPLSYEWSGELIRIAKLIR
ncbi:MAG: metal ABC transporter solute-binding protein, Zn/Mn family [Fermentimonas sp.]